MPHIAKIRRYVNFINVTNVSDIGKVDFDKTTGKFQFEYFFIDQKSDINPDTGYFNGSTMETASPENWLLVENWKSNSNYSPIEAMFASGQPATRYDAPSTVK